MVDYLGSFEFLEHLFSRSHDLESSVYHDTLPQILNFILLHF